MSEAFLKILQDAQGSPVSREGAVSLAMQRHEPVFVASVQMGCVIATIESTGSMQRVGSFVKTGNVGYGYAGSEPHAIMLANHLSGMAVENYHQISPDTLKADTLAREAAVVMRDRFDDLFGKPLETSVVIAEMSTEFEQDRIYVIDELGNATLLPASKPWAIVPDLFQNNVSADWWLSDNFTYNAWDSPEEVLRKFHLIATAWIAYKKGLTENTVLRATVFTRKRLLQKDYSVFDMLVWPKEPRPVSDELAQDIARINAGPKVPMPKLRKPDPNKKTAAQKYGDKLVALAKEFSHKKTLAGQREKGRSSKDSKKTSRHSQRAPDHALAPNPLQYADPAERVIFRCFRVELNESKFISEKACTPDLCEDYLRLLERQYQEEVQDRTRTVTDNVAAELVIDARFFVGHELNRLCRVMREEIKMPISTKGIHAQGGSALVIAAGTPSPPGEPSMRCVSQYGHFEISLLVQPYDQRFQLAKFNRKRTFSAPELTDVSASGSTDIKSMQDLLEFEVNRQRINQEFLELLYAYCGDAVLPLIENLLIKKQVLTPEEMRTYGLADCVIDE